MLASMFNGSFTNSTDAKVRAGTSLNAMSVYFCRLHVRLHELVHEKGSAGPPSLNLLPGLGFLRMYHSHSLGMVFPSHSNHDVCRLYQLAVIAAGSHLH